jgi:Na+-transporting NADH:ubiquinone oxidoreductase subunit A
LAVHRIKKGVDLPISGAPEPGIHEGPPLTRVALLGDDTSGVRAKLAVAEGDMVLRGQLLFEDRTRPGIRYTAPGAGRVSGIFRGARRMLRSVVVQLSEHERAGQPSDDEFVSFASWVKGAPEGESREQVRALLVESGLWTALRERPFGKIPDPESDAQALFVTAIDTNPLAPDPDVVVDEARDEFNRGLRIVSKLVDGPTYLCVAHRSNIPGVNAPVQVEHFKGKHPAGNPGVHIHHLAPVSRHLSSWHLGYQDVIAIARLFETGRLAVERVISLAGPLVARPRLIRTRLGGSIDEITHDELVSDERGTRVLSGSVFSGKSSMGPELGFVGRYHNQITVIAEGKDRRLVGWMLPWADRFSTLGIYPAKLIPGKTFDMTTDTNGSQRSLMPIGTYEHVLPMDILATYLLRAIVVGDTEQAEALGALELDEEDVAMCTFVCPGKTEFGPYLRKNLEMIEKDG